MILSYERFNFCKSFRDSIVVKWRHKASKYISIVCLGNSLWSFQSQDIIATNNNLLAYYMPQHVKLYIMNFRKPFHV